MADELAKLEELYKNNFILENEYLERKQILQSGNNVSQFGGGSSTLSSSFGSSFSSKDLSWNKGRMNYAAFLDFSNNDKTLTAKTTAFFTISLNSGFQKGEQIYWETTVHQVGAYVFVGFHNQDFKNFESNYMGSLETGWSIAPNYSYHRESTGYYKSLSQQNLGSWNMVAGTKVGVLLDLKTDAHKDEGSFTIYDNNGKLLNTLYRFPLINPTTKQLETFYPGVSFYSPGDKVTVNWDATMPSKN